MAEQLPVEEFVLEVGDSKFVYYDSGIPSTAGEPYTTVILLHGLLFNHRIWKRLFSVVPPNTRVLAHTTRGLAPSSPFSQDDLATPALIRDRLGTDLASTITTYISKLNLLDHPQSKIKLVAWSLGGLTVISAYNLLRAGSLETENATTLKEKISDIIFFEPPGQDVLGLEKSTHTIKTQAWVATLDPKEIPEAITRYISGIWDYPPEVFTELEKGRRVTDKFWDMQSSLWDDEKYKGFIEQEKVADPAALSTHGASGVTIDEVGRAYARSGLESIVNTSAVGTVTVMVTKRCLPECFEGSAELVGILDKMGVAAPKKQLHIVEGPWNHELHYQAPELFWANILQE